MVLAGLPEPISESLPARARGDFNSVCKILDSCGIEGQPSVVYRLGKPNVDNGNKPRLLKIQFPQRIQARLFLEKRGKLKNISSDNLYLRESLTAEQRSELISECTEKNKTLSGEEKVKNPFVVYAWRILRRSEINNKMTKTNA